MFLGVNIYLHDNKTNLFKINVKAHAPTKICEVKRKYSTDIKNLYLDVNALSPFRIWFSLCIFRGVTQRNWKSGHLLNIKACHQCF